MHGNCRVCPSKWHSKLVKSQMQFTARLNSLTGLSMFYIEKPWPPETYKKFQLCLNRWLKELMPIWRRVSLQWKFLVIMWTRKHLKVPLKFLSDFDSLSKKRSKLTAYEFDVQNSDEIGMDIFHTDAGVSINPVGSGLPPPGRLPPSVEPASWLVVVVFFSATIAHKLSAAANEKSYWNPYKC